MGALTRESPGALADEEPGAREQEQGHLHERIVQTKSKAVVQSTLLAPRPNRFTTALPPRGSRDPRRLAEGGALLYEGARHCPSFSLRASKSKVISANVFFLPLLFY